MSCWFGDSQIPVYPGFAKEEASVPNPRESPTRMGASAGPNTFACLGSRPTPNAMKINACANIYSKANNSPTEQSFVSIVHPGITSWINRSAKSCHKVGSHFLPLESMHLPALDVARSLPQWLQLTAPRCRGSPFGASQSRRRRLPSSFNVNCDQQQSLSNDVHNSYNTRIQMSARSRCC